MVSCTTDHFQSIVTPQVDLKTKPIRAVGGKRATKVDVLEYTYARWHKLGTVLTYNEKGSKYIEKA